VAAGRSLGNPIIAGWLVEAFFSNCEAEAHSEATI